MNRLRTTGAALALLLVLVGVPAAQAAPMAQLAAAAPVVHARPAWCIPLPWRKCPERAAAAETAPVRCLTLLWHKCPVELKGTPQPIRTVAPTPPEPTKSAPTARPPRVTPIGPPVPVNPVAPPPTAAAPDGAPARPQERVQPVVSTPAPKPVLVAPSTQSDRGQRSRPAQSGPAICGQCADRAAGK